MSDSIPEDAPQDVPEAEYIEDDSALGEGNPTTLAEALSSRTSGADASTGVDDADIEDEEEDNNTPVPLPPIPGVDDAGQDDAFA